VGKFQNSRSEGSSPAAVNQWDSTDRLSKREVENLRRRIKAGSIARKQVAYIASKYQIIETTPSSSTGIRAKLWLEIQGYLRAGIEQEPE